MFSCCYEWPLRHVTENYTLTKANKSFETNKKQHSQGTLIDPGMMPYSLSSHGSLTSITEDFWPARRTFNCSYVTSVLGGLELNLRSSNTVAKSKTYNKRYTYKSLNHGNHNSGLYRLQRYMRIKLTFPTAVNAENAKRRVLSYGVRRPWGDGKFTDP